MDVSLVTTTDPATGEVLDRPPFVMTRTKLVVNGLPTLDQWIAFGQVLVDAASSLQWMIGDWINYAKERADWGEKYAQAVSSFKLEYQYLCNVAWVAREFESSRRRDNLTFSHHAEVAALPQPLQDVLLDRAEDQQMSTRELREEKRRETGRPIHGDELDRFSGNFDQAVRWLADMKFKHGWQKRIRIVIFEE